MVTWQTGGQEMSKGQEPIVSCRGLRKWFQVSASFFSQLLGGEVYLKAVDGVDLTSIPKNSIVLQANLGAEKRQLVNFSLDSLNLLMEL